MADDTLKNTLGTPQPGGISRKGRAGEPLTIDQKTYEIRGTESGTVYGKGRNLQEALGLQTQIQSGGTPTVSGRPDLFGVSPLPDEVVKPITGAGGQDVTPRVATLGELEQAGAGTLESFNKATGAPPLPPRERDKKFADAMKEVVQAGADKGRESLFATGADGIPQDFDTQLLVQKGILMAAALGEHVTPEELRFLSPDQQRMIRDGKKEALISHAAGLGNIITGRKKQRDDERERKRLEEATALTRIESLRDLGLLGGMDASALQTLADQTGISVEALQDMIDAENAGGQWEIGNDPNGNLVMYRFDPVQGTYESKVIERKIRSTGSRTSESDDEKEIQAFKKQAADLIIRLDDPDDTLEWGAAFDSMKAQYPSASNETIDTILGGSFNAETGEATGRASSKF